VIRPGPLEKVTSQESPVTSRQQESVGAIGLTLTTSCGGRRAEGGGLETEDWRLETGRYSFSAFNVCRNSFGPAYTRPV
jgi:hypothetical protein